MQPEVNPAEKPFSAQLPEQQKEREKDPPVFTLKISGQVEHTTKYPSDGDEV